MANTINTGPLPGVSTTTDTEAIANIIETGSSPSDSITAFATEANANAINTRLVPSGYISTPASKIMANTIDIYFPPSNCTAKPETEAMAAKTCSASSYVTPTPEPKTIIDNTNTDSFSFLKLPPGIRNSIYRLTLAVEYPLKVASLLPSDYEQELRAGSINFRTEYVAIDDPRFGNAKSHFAAVSGVTTYRFHGDRPVAGENLALSMLMLKWQSRKEAVSIYYNENTFNSDSISCFVPFILDRPVGQQSNRCIANCCCEWVNLQVRMDEFGAGAGKMKHEVCQLTGLVAGVVSRLYKRDADLSG